jgi:hypothetical protein
MIKYPVNVFSKQQLEMQSKPDQYNQPEFIPWGWYDSQDFATLWTQVSFFAATNNDPTITNIEQANTFAADQYFRPYCLTLDWLITATSVTSSAANPIVDDLLQIQNGARAIFYLLISQKRYVQIPIHALHASGGIYVSYQTGTPTGSGLGNYGMNWMPDGGYWVNGAMVFGPRMTFGCSVQGVAAALVSTRKGRITFHGSLARRAL